MPAILDASVQVGESCSFAGVSTGNQSCEKLPLGVRWVVGKPLDWQYSPTSASPQLSVSIMIHYRLELYGSLTVSRNSNFLNSGL